MADNSICTIGDADKRPRVAASGEAQRFFREVVLQYEGDDCLIWPFAKTRGYGSIRIAGKSHLVPRLACTDANGEPPTVLHQSAHSCGNGHVGCVTKRHLSWKLPIENQADRVVHGTDNRGERSGSAKLTPLEVKEIRSAAKVESYSVIAARFGISKGNVCLIVKRKTWADLE